MAITQDEMKKQTKEPKKSILTPLFFSILFIIFGLLLILKSLNIQYAVLQNSFIKYLPEQVLLLISGIGSVFGGLYFFYRKFIYRQRIVYRG